MHQRRCARWRRARTSTSATGARCSRHNRHRTSFGRLALPRWAVRLGFRPQRSQPINQWSVGSAVRSVCDRQAVLERSSDSSMSCTRPHCRVVICTKEVVVPIGGVVAKHANHVVKPRGQWLWRRQTTAGRDENTPADKQDPEGREWRRSRRPAARDWTAPLLSSVWSGACLRLAPSSWGLPLFSLLGFRDPTP
jgi:hypothetical protein